MKLRRRTKLNRMLNPFWGLGWNPRTWLGYWLRRAKRSPRYSYRMDHEWSVDFACLVVRLRQIRTESGDTIDDFILHRVLTCDLPRMEQYLTGAQWELIEEAEDNVMGGNGSSGSSGKAADRSFRRKLHGR